MQSKEDILKELESWNSTLAYMPRTMPYVVPVGYFQEFSTILHHLCINDVTTLNMPFDVPANYFKQLPHQILNTIRTEETINTLPRQLPFEVATSYFEKLPAQILQAAKENSGKKKSVSLSRRVFYSVRWVAAAILLLSIGAGSYSYIETHYRIATQEEAMLKTSPVPSPEQAITNLSRKDINTYIDQNLDDFDSDMLLDDAVSENVATPNPLSVQQLSNKDIETYLNETGWN